MSNLFETFPETPDAAYSINESQDHMEDASDLQCKMAKHLTKYDKKLKKLQRQNKKILQRLAELNERYAAVEQQKADDEATKKKSVLAEWGKAIRKSLPKIIAVISTIVAGIFARKNRRTANA